MKNEKKGSFLGLLPLIVFLVAYMGTGLGTGSFDNMPLMTGIAIASGVALLLNKRDKKTPFEKKIALYCKGGGEETLILMVLIFLLAGAFGGVAKGMGAVDSIVNMGLTILPGNLILPGIFLIGCLLSFSMGTSMGTVAALMPIAVDISNKTGINVCLLAGAVVGGAMFGDNLSFISDTTIAATRTQEVSMKDKFKANILMVLPAVIINVILLAIQSSGDVSLGNIGSFSFVNIIPYILVIALSLVGLNVVVVMIIGILSGVVIGCFNGGFTLIQSLTIIHDGAIGMEDMALIAVMVGGMVELMKHFGGMDFLMNQLTKGAKSSRGGELSIAALVSLLDIATTNNTISIIAAGPIARDIADNFHISRSRVASILDLFSSAFNGLLPYAGQLLVAGGLANVSPTAIMGYNWHSMLMIVFGIVFIVIGFPKFKDIRVKKEQIEKEA
ncbi:Na+/H+ antiporter NhaC family protein [[Clostridium] innocuum]|nr:Na+/H+ antiporter NhaC family protein [[Clostridium] innocuum]